MEDQINQILEALTEAIQAIVEAAKIVAEWIRKVISSLTPVVEYISSALRMRAYAKASASSPKWVHFALYGKNKRVRKKYDDRIMRRYSFCT